jgi:hypothetical protein
MCYFCTGERPDYQQYLASVQALRAGIVDEASFLDAAQQADRLRFQSSAEWVEPPIAAQVEVSIFRNPDPDEGLLLFVLSAWLDLQTSYIYVWNKLLVRTQAWVRSTAWSNPEADVPRGNFSATRPHLLKTTATLAQPAYGRSMAAWFTSAILGIAQRNGPRNGNLYRFVSRLCTDLYEAKDLKFTDHLREGELPDDYMGTHYKRLWMLIMFLKRDEVAIRCLLRRALGGSDEGREALRFWESDLYFDPQESELPVDTRVKQGWGRLPFTANSYKDVHPIGREARKLARAARVPPSSFDAILFF